MWHSESAEVCWTAARVQWQNESDSNKKLLCTQADEMKGRELISIEDVYLGGSLWKIPTAIRGDDKLSAKKIGYNLW